MNSAYIRAIRGPILLMVLGALILIDHRGDVSFWRTWPLLLITGGILVLAERAAIRENPWVAGEPRPVPQPPSAITYRPFGQPDPAPPPVRNDETGGPQA
jgi:hypothetical protein